MATMNRKQLEEAVEQTLGSDYEILASDAEDDDDPAVDSAEEVSADASSASIDAVREKYAKLLGDDPPKKGKVVKKTTAALLGSKAGAAGDDGSGTRRIRVFAPDGKSIVAEQG